MVYEHSVISIMSCILRAPTSVLLKEGEVISMVLLRHYSAVSLIQP